MTDTFVFASGLSPLETAGLILVAVLAVSGLWFWISEALDALTEREELREARRQFQLSQARFRPPTRPVGIPKRF